MPDHLDDPSRVNIFITEQFLPQVSIFFIIITSNYALLAVFNKKPLNSHNVEKMSEMGITRRQIWAPWYKKLQFLSFQQFKKQNLRPYEIVTVFIKHKSLTGIQCRSNQVDIQACLLKNACRWPRSASSLLAAYFGGYRATLKKSSSLSKEIRCRSKSALIYASHAQAAAGNFNSVLEI